jgi:small subunit ribosomal protein S17
MTTKETKPAAKATAAPAAPKAAAPKAAPKAAAPKAAAAGTAGAAPVKHKATKVGIVESDKRSKTRMVVVRFLAKHPKYGKFMRRRTVLHVHDENNDSKLGDTVEVVQTRPISKTKFWTLVRVVERNRKVQL